MLNHTGIITPYNSYYSLFAFLCWHDLKVKTIKIQQQIFCPEEKEMPLPPDSYVFQIIFHSAIPPLHSHCTAKETILYRSLAENKNVRSYDFALEYGLFGCGARISCLGLDIWQTVCYNNAKITLCAVSAERDLSKMKKGEINRSFSQAGKILPGTFSSPS